MCLVVIMKWAPLSENMFQWMEFKVMGQVIDLSSGGVTAPPPLPSNVKKYMSSFP